MMENVGAQVTTAHVETSVDRQRTVDIAGTAWPLYKLEALAAGLLVLVVTAVIVQAAQTAVLAAAAVTLVVWLVGSTREATRP